MSEEMLGGVSDEWNGIYSSLWRS